LWASEEEAGAYQARAKREEEPQGVVHRSMDEERFRQAENPGTAEKNLAGGEWKRTVAPPRRAAVVEEDRCC